MKLHPQLIEKKGKKEFVVLPKELCGWVAWSKIVG